MRAFLLAAACLAMVALAAAPAASAGPLAPVCNYTSTYGGVVGATIDYSAQQCAETDGIIFGGGSVIGLIDNTSCYALGTNC